MSQRTTALRIASPCSESWAAMTPTATGRHCAACQKPVVDFTHKTDAEILAALRHAAGETCGRLRADQLGRPLMVPTPAPRWRAWLGAALALGGALGAGRAAAQSPRTNYYAGPQPAPSSTNNAAAPAPDLQAPIVSATTETAAGPLTVRGIVLDSASHQGLPGVMVLVKGTNSGVSTAVNGAFELPVAVGARVAPVLTFSYIGYVGQERAVTPGSNQPLAIALATDVTSLMGEVVIIGGIAQKPWPWHPRRFFNWGKYWVSKPFRS